ncbi:beta-defensin 112 isoform X2 [Eptesicus fuscus]|uniref:beta-defensin 112 isoform X2 n=1 Tax=Eptesicus fuscus TaxID=29078 RepID=UPI002403F89D|nr:beta-defensin 112 isoform X2 [Eptesicus fuscus]
MKILLFSFILFFFGVFILSVGSGQPVSDSMPAAVTCRKKLEKAYSKIHNPPTIFEKAQNHAASSKEDPFVLNRSEICVKLSGQCKRKCGEKEFRMVYCVIPTVLCCIRECDPEEYY